MHFKPRYLDNAIDIIYKQPSCFISGKLSVQMISAEAPVLFAKAAEIFIHELTMRAWIHTEVNNFFFQ